MENEAVPLAAFTWNFSSMFFNAPPPLGRDIVGVCIVKLSMEMKIILVTTFFFAKNSYFLISHIEIFRSMRTIIINTGDRKEYAYEYQVNARY